MVQINGADNMGFPSRDRHRRLRRTPAIRKLLAETHLSVDDFIAPLFIQEGITTTVNISALPGQKRWPINQVATEVQRLQSLGLSAVLLFGLPSTKNACGTSAMGAQSVVAQAITRIKKDAPDCFVIADLCFCEYTDHGHCGVLDGSGSVDNDATLPLLAQQAVDLALAGADMVAPSGMLDGMVAVIRRALDAAGQTHCGIMSYAVKYASAFYGPFREAAGGSPGFGDRKSHQMDIANAQEAIREARSDAAQSADILMVKPAGTYLDVIQRVKSDCQHLPLAAYQVSGEYAMLYAAAQQGVLTLEEAMLESLLAIKRAGADLIISYYAAEYAKSVNRS